MQLLRWRPHQDLGGVSRVDGDAVDQHFQSLWLDDVWFRDSLVVCITYVRLYHCHPVHCQRARLV